MATELTDKERRQVLWHAMYTKGSITRTEAWDLYHCLGIKQSGIQLVEADLHALARNRRAKRNDGFWRHINDPDHIRSKFTRWADYWTARGRPE